MKKIVPQTIASRINTKNDTFQKHKDQNQTILKVEKKNLYHKKLYQGRTQKKKTFFRRTKTNIKTQNSHGSSAHPQGISNPKKRRCVFQRCQN